jgi:4-amino-4-deoxy-L-arabinose transferase-like glycosyltransferase
MAESVSRKMLMVYLLLLVPIEWLAARFDAYQIDGDAVGYMDIADLMRAHKWAGVVNGYWHPLYPACLALAQRIFHTTRWNELGAYYALNFFIFLAQVAAMLLFVAALDRLRGRMSGTGAAPLLSLNVLRLLGVGLLVIAAQRELSMGKVRPDALLQALLLAAFAMLLESLAVETLSGAALFFAPLMGLFFGLAYLTKSFAFLVALLSIGLMVVFQAWIQRRPLWRVALGGALALLVFALVAGPYIAALSMQKHRFDFGDSGALNYAWYAGGTEKMHLEPWMTGQFGSASVHLVHPEQQLLASPGVYSYRAEPYGTYPPWFDTTFFNERIVPHLNLRVLLRRDARNVVLVLRYLLNHPEAWILLALMLVFGARFGFRRWRSDGFWLPMMLLGMAMWCIYGLVNIEERYVTLAYLVMMLSAFAALQGSVSTADTADMGRATRALLLPKFAAAMVIALSFLAMGGSLRIALENRRNSETAGVPHTWYSPRIYGAALGLAALGVKPGDEIACIGTTACLNDIYWARLAGVRILTEVYNPEPAHLLEQIEGLPNRDQVYNLLKAQGAKVVVANFDASSTTDGMPAASGWLRLGDTDFYAMPLNLKAPEVPAAPATLPWSGKHISP